MSQLHLSSPVPLSEIAGVRLFAMLWGGLFVVDVSRLLGLGVSSQVVALLVLAFACCVGGGALIATGVAPTGWLVANGFVMHLDGQLGWAGAADLFLLALFGLAAVLGTEVGR